MKLAPIVTVLPHLDRLALGKLIIHDPQQERESTPSTANNISVCGSGEQSDEPASDARQVSPDTVTASIYSESAEPEDVEANAKSSPISFTAAPYAPRCASSCSCCISPPNSQAIAMRPTPVRPTPVQAVHQPSTGNSIDGRKRKHISIEGVGACDSIVLSSSSGCDVNNSRAASTHDAIAIANAVQLLYEVMKRGEGPPSVVMQNLAHAVLEKCSGSSSSEFELKHIDTAGRCRRSSYIKLKSQRSLKPTAKDSSRQQYVREKVNELESMTSILSDANNDELKRAILKKMANRHGFLLLSLEDLKLSPAELVAIRDHVQTGTNGMYRLKQALETFRPELKGKLLPPSIRKLLSDLEKQGVVPVKVVEVNCTITNKGNRRGMCTYHYVGELGHLLEAMIARPILDGTFLDSIDISSLPDTVIVAVGIDKSENDLAGTIRVCNKDKGNSCNDTQAFAVLEGPVAENYDNEKLTFFNPAYPTGEYLMRLMDDSLQALIFVVGRSSPDGLPLDCAVAIFLPIPMLDSCTERHFKVESSPLAVNEQLVEYDSHQQMRGLAPEVVISKGQDIITVGLVHAEDDANVINGYQILVDKVVVSTQKLHTPFELRGRSPSDVEGRLGAGAVAHEDDVSRIVLLLRDGSECMQEGPPFRLALFSQSIIL